jgi:hypothetical protein
MKTKKGTSSCQSPHCHVVLVVHSATGPHSRLRVVTHLNLVLEHVRVLVTVRIQLQHRKPYVIKLVTVARTLRVAAPGAAACNSTTSKTLVTAALTCFAPACAALSILLAAAEAVKTHVSCRGTSMHRQPPQGVDVPCQTPARNNGGRQIAVILHSIVHAYRCCGP